MMDWRFYVYELTDEAGNVRYVGKGCGHRLAAQKRMHALAGYEVARFKREKDAYAFERKRIAEMQPERNRHPGGNGSRATPVLERKFAWVREMERIGTRVYAARFLLARATHLIEPSKVEALRRIAHGAGA